jgi:hypothetical protein
MVRRSLLLMMIILVNGGAEPLRITLERADVLGTLAV